MLVNMVCLTRAAGRKQDLDRVQARRKLMLVLDLDHTLLNSCRDSDLQQEHRQRLHELLEAQQDPVSSCLGCWTACQTGSSSRCRCRRMSPSDGLTLVQATQELFHLAHMGKLWTKFRPGLRAFLQALQPLFELAIYTHGDRAYASEMARLIDPGSKLFGGRVISQVRHSAASSWALRDVLRQPQARSAGCRATALSSTSRAWTWSWGLRRPS